MTFSHFLFVLPWASYLLALYLLLQFSGCRNRPGSGSVGKCMLSKHKTTQPIYKARCCSHKWLCESVIPALVFAYMVGIGAQFLRLQPLTLDELEVHWEILPQNKKLGLVLWYVLLIPVIQEAEADSFLEGWGQLRLPSKFQASQGFKKRMVEGFAWCCALSIPAFRRQKQLHFCESEASLF